MHALTTFPLKGDFWVVPQLGFELGSCCITETCEKQKN